MFFNPSALVAVLGLVSAAPAFSVPTGSVRRSLASKPERRALKNSDPQTSLTLDPSQVAPGLAKNGQEAGAEPGQVASLTSTNNFINFCLTQTGVPLTNGQQVKGGSCNAVPMGRIIASNKMPSSKFVNPKNGATIPANTAFTIQMAISNMVTGHFVNPTTNYYSAPQQVDGSGTVIGHTHVTVETLKTLDQTTVTDPTKFAFFKGLNAPATNGIVSADVTTGLAPGAYRMCSINSAANHQPVLVAVAQRGSTDDCVYFTVSSCATAAATTVAKTAATGNNIQTFTGSLGGGAPSVTVGGRGFLVSGNSFLNKAGALQRSCDEQKNTCADAANSSSNKAPLTVAACETQHTACIAGITA